MTMDWEGMVDPDQISTTLLSAKARELAPDMFCRLVFRALSSSSSEEVLWNIAGAIYEYLRFHPGAFVAPSSLANQLLQSPDEEKRESGLRLLRHCGVEEQEYLDVMLRSLGESGVDMRLCALHQLSFFMTKTSVKDPQVWVDSLAPTLQHIRDSDHENVNQNIAVRFIEFWHDNGVMPTS